MSTKAWVVTCLATGLLGFGIGMSQRGDQQVPAVAATPPPSLPVEPPPPAKEPAPQAQVQASPPVETPQPIAATTETAADRREVRQKEMIAARQNEFLAKMDGQRHATYDALLTGLGLDAGQIKEVSQKLRALHQEAMIAGEPMMELAQKRADYDRHMKELLGKDGYQVYREFEESKPYRMEVERIAAAAAAKSTPIEPAHQQQLVSLLGKFGIKLSESWDGPYDVLPSPMVGAEPIVKKLSAQAKLVNEGLPAMEQDPAWQTLPKEVASAVSDYYRKRAEELGREAERIHQRSLLTPEQRREQVRQDIREMEAQMRLERGQKATPDLRTTKDL